MEKEAPPRRSVAELAGKFKGPAPQPNSPAGNQEDKPVRRRPPRTLPLPNTDEAQPPSGVTSPSKVKRNSALIEKLQANLTLGSPTAVPLKSPCRKLPPGFTLPSPGSAPPLSIVTPTSPAPISPSTEIPTSFEAPPSAGEGNILPSINKGRARLSIRRRPPSRRHRKSSSGDDMGVGQDAAETHLSSRDEGEEKTAAEEGGEEDEGGEVFKKEGPTEPSAPQEPKEAQEMKSNTDVKEGEEEKKEEERGQSSSLQGEEEEEKKEEERGPSSSQQGEEEEEKKEEE
ncbi:PREDICTED: capZ-interacting protein-like, partial [Cyprinodon variegatus]